MAFLTRWVLEFWSFLVEAGGPLLFGFALAGVIAAVVPQRWIAGQLGKRGWWSVLKASLIGVPMPLCSCSVIPTAAALRRGGASRGASAAFAVSTPEVDAPAISLTWGMLGPVLAVARPIAALASAFVTGVLVDRVGGEVEPQGDAPTCGCSEPAKKACCHEEPVEKACCGAGEAPSASLEDSRGTSPAGAGEVGAGPPPASKTRPPPPPGAGEECGCCHSAAPTEPSGESVVWERFVSSLRHGFWVLPRDLAPWFAVGLGLSALIAAALPEGYLESWAGDGIAAKLVMLAVGVPFYVCATASTPLAAALIAAGLSPGAALVFLLAGPATNPAAMGWVIKDLGGRALVVYLAVISAVALGSGVLLDAAWPGAAVVSGEHVHSAGSLVFGALLALVLGVGLARRCGEMAAKLSGARGGVAEA